MPEDRYLISSQTHELNYVLRKWDKKQNKKNREILRGVLKDFRAGQSYKPHTRKNFYKYAEDNDILKLLEDEKKKKSTGKKAEIMPDIDTGDLTIEDPYIHKAKKHKGKKQKIKIHELTTHKGTNLTTFKPGEKAKSIKQGSKKGSKKTFFIILILILIAILIITLIFVGTCIFQNTQAGKTDPSLTEDVTTHVQPEEKNEEDDSASGMESETEKESYTVNSLKEFIKTNTPLHFKGDLDELVEGEGLKINKLASYLDNYTLVKLSIQGHTASIGEPENEMDLSIKRADHIADLLKEKVKNAELKLEILGYGAEREAIQNPSKEKMKLNRRVEIIVIQAH